jgi:hypothetical protein
MIFSCSFVMVLIPVKLLEFRGVFNSCCTAMEGRAKKKLVESLVAEQILWLLEKDVQYFVVSYRDSCI